MKAYSEEFRGEVLAACDANEGTHDIAVRFKVSGSWVRLSARALIVLKAIFVSFAQLGMSPHFSKPSCRLPSTNRTAGTGAVGGML
jgi:hypothetical protein